MISFIIYKFKFIYEIKNIKIKIKISNIYQISIEDNAGYDHTIDKHDVMKVT
jgi:hypothetical protein